MAAPRFHNRALVTDSGGTIASAIIRELQKLAFEGILKSGIQISAHFKGQPLLSVWGGACPKSGTAVTEDSLFMAYSVAKGVTSTALCMHVGKAGMSFDDSVAAVWPEFAGADKGSVTIGDAAGYRAGMPTHPSLVNQMQQFRRGGWEGHWNNGKEWVEKAVPEWTPGTKAGYHAMSYSWIVGGIVEALDAVHTTNTKDGVRRPLSQIISEDIALPIGRQREMFLGRLPAEERHRVVKLTPLVPKSVVQICGVVVGLGAAIEARRQESSRKVKRQLSVSVNLQRTCGGTLLS